MRRRAGKCSRALRAAGLAVAALAAAALAARAAAAEGGERGERLEELRELETVLVSTIERAEKAFVFIEGGSGFLVSADGYALTNEHVVGGRPALVVQLANGRRYNARVAGHDPAGDVALLKLEGASDLEFLELGDSDALRVGQPVVAIGDPFLVGSAPVFFGRAPPSQQPSSSFGYVSALHRYSDVYADAIQVDVPVNRGNSGGPLLTLDGKVVGINGKIETRFAIGINSGVGYAVPSNQIRRFLEPLKKAEGGNVLHGVLAGLHVEERAEGRGGLRVAKVEPGSSAEAAGFREGDLIASIEGYPVPTRNRFRGIVHGYPVGWELAVRVLRGGDALQLRQAVEQPGTAFLGVEVAEVPDAGVVVDRVVPGSPAAEAGIRAGDALRVANGLVLRDVQSLERLLRGLRPGDLLQLVVVREGSLVAVQVALVDERSVPKESP